jgi:phosphoribosyl 1,2-cyclic phosphodiesterase
MEARFCPLYSGSGGNAIYIGYGDTHILVDAGLPGRTVEQALQSIGVRPGDISTVFVTHEHIDHVRGVGVLARRTGAAVYANERTWSAMERPVGALPLAQRRVFEEEQDFYVGGISVQPYAIPHDAADPVGYCFYMGDKKISIATDLGHANTRIIDRVADSDILLLEANHDVDMLERNPRYPAALKRRIRGSRGHLSNDQCADALAELVRRGVRTVYLAHLSEHNNTPQIAYDTVAQHLAEQGALVGRDVARALAARDSVGELLVV